MTIHGEIKSYFATESKCTGFYTHGDGNLVVFNDSGTLKAFNKENEEPKVFTILENLTCVAVKDDHFITTSVSGECFLYNFKNTAPKLLHRSLLPLRSACFNHDGSIAVIGGDESELILVDVHDQSQTKVKLSEEILNLTYNNSNDLLAITVSSGDVLIYSLSSSPPSLITKLDKITHNVIFDDEDKTEEENLLATNCEWGLTDFLLVASPDRSVKAFNRGDKFIKEEKVFANQHESKITDFKVSFNGKYLASLDLKKNLVIWNFKTGKLIKKFEVELDNDQDVLGKLFWSPDNLTVSIATFEGSIIKYLKVISESEQEEDSVPFIADEAKDASEDEDQDEEIEGDEIPQRQNFAFEDEEDFIIDDDNGGYSSKRLFVDEDEEEPGTRSKKIRASETSHLSEPRYKLKPFAPGSTPWHSDRRYLTMNSIGYAWSVKQNTNSTITVSFFDRSLFKEYHFKDIYGYDLASMNEIGVLFATSGFNKKASKLKIMFRPHENVSETWEIDIPLSKNEFLTTVTVANNFIAIGSSTGLLRFHNLFGVPIGLEKQNPIISCVTNNKFILTITFNERSQQFNYSIQDLDFKYYQRDVALPISVPSFILKNNKHDFIKGVFFSEDGDPIVVGHDNLVLVLSKWRDPLQSRWFPILDINEGINQIGGVGDDLKCWPLGLYKNKLSCILVRGNLNGIYPSFPLPLPTELDIKIPIKTYVKDDEEQDPEEEFVRSKIMGDLLLDTISNGDVSDQFELEQRLVELQLLYDKSLLKIFVSCCNDQNSLKAFNIVQEMKEDKLLMASVKIAERMGLIGLVRRINELRENRMELEMSA